MANLSNINNKLIVTDGGNLLVNATANLATYGGITIDNFSDPSIAMKTTGTSGWLWTQYITSTGTNNFSMGVNQTAPYWCVKAGAGMDSPHLVVNSSGSVGIGTTSPGNKLEVFAPGNGDGILIQSDPAGVNRAPALHLNPIAASADGRNWAISPFRDIPQSLSFSSSNAKGGDGYAVATTRMIIDGITGNVGIGNINPQYPLHFGSIGSYHISIGAGNTAPGGNTPWFGVFNNNSIASANYGWGIYDSSTDGSFQIWNRAGNTTGYNTFTIKRGGNVGIGTVNPRGKLEVEVPTGTGIDADEHVLISDGVATNPQQMRLGVNTASNYSYIQSAHEFIAYAPLILNPKAGNVGIGVTSPQKNLHIEAAGQGDSVIRLSAVGNSAYYSDIINSVSAARGFAIQTQGTDAITIAGPGGYSGITIGRTSTNLLIKASSGEFVFTGGNVGINTTSPDYELDVNGSIRAGRVTTNVQYYATTNSASNQYFHIKTSVNANSQTCMHTWSIEGYAYGSQTIIDCKLAFHTDSSNNIYGLSYLGSLANNIYRSGDNYVVLVFGTLNTYYTHFYVNLFEGMYTPLNSTVLAVAYSPNNSGVY